MCKVTFFSRLILVGALTWSTVASSKLVGAKKSEFHMMLENNWPDPDPSITHFPHQTSCHYFYLVLSEEDVSIKKCPDGKLFDYFLHRCIEKESARCWSRRFSGVIHDHHKAHKKFKCPYGYGKFPDVTDCTRYYQCLSGKPRIKKCAPFEYFDKIKRKCMAEIHAVCADETDVVEHGYKCPRAEGSFTFSKDCSKYYQCIEKRPDLRTCPKYRLFDERKRKCISSEVVHCGPRYNPYESTTVSSLPIDDQTDRITNNHKFTSETASQQTGNTDSATSHTDAKFLVHLSTSNNKDYATAVTGARNVVTEHDSSENDISKESHESSEDHHKNDLKGSMNSAEEIKKQSSTESDEDSREDNSKNSKKDNLENDLKEYSEDPEVDNSNFTNEFISTVKIELSNISSTIQEAVTNAKNLSFTQVYPIAKVDKQCHPKDPTCIRVRDKVIRCPDADGFFPHPDDKSRFLHCSKFKIHVKSCPKQLTFQVSTNACGWSLDQAQKNP